MGQCPQYKTLQQLDLSRDDLCAWADSRNTDEVVALAIHAIADPSRSPEAIWDVSRREVGLNGTLCHATGE